MAFSLHHHSMAELLSQQQEGEKGGGVQGCGLGCKLAVMQQNGT